MSRLIVVIAPLLFHMAVAYGATRQLRLNADGYSIAAGETAIIRVAAEERRLTAQPRKLSSQTSPDPGQQIGIGQDKETGELFLAVPLAMPPGTYYVSVSVAEGGADDAQTVLRVTVEPLPRLALGQRPPVVLMNGWQFTCPPAKSSREAFGFLEEYLHQDGIPPSNVIFFDNCLGPNDPIEDLGEKLGQVLSMLRYVDGTPVPEVDIVAHSMGGLIARAYLSGKQTGSGIFSPPSVTRIRKLVFIGTPHFGSGLAPGIGIQASAMRLGSTFLFDVAQWNQKADDLRSLDVLAIIGTGGSSGGIQGLGDGVVALTSASLSFAFGVSNERTRIVPYCHTEPIPVFVVCSNPTPIAKIETPVHETSRIVRWFLAGTNEWRSIGSTPAQHPYLSQYGGVYLTFNDANRNVFTDVDRVVYATSSGTHELAKLGGIFYSEWVPRGSCYTFQMLLRGQWWQAQGTTSVGGFGILAPKFGPIISRVIPSAGVPVPDTLNLAGGSLISLFGANLASSAIQANSLPLPTEASGVRLTANGQALGLLYVGPAQINAYLPPNVSGLVQLRISNAEGQDSTTLWIEPSVPAIFTLNGTGTGPAAAVNAVTGQIISSNNRIGIGDYVALFVTGLGPTYRSDSVDLAFTEPRLFLGGQEVAVLFAGLTPGFVGLYQVNFQVPAWAQRGSAVLLYLAGPQVTSNMTSLAIQ